ncbi:MAG: ribosome small subunit-dependent GTPase A [Ezakiella sp.]|nr:ribosome small subunit-dependent GTPase A [Ezakiella sp.]
MQGIISRVAGGVFIAISSGNKYRLHSPGKIKSRSKLVVGDRVIFEKEGEDYVIKDMLPRKNTFERPQAANIDIFLIAASIKEPDFDAILTDKMTVYSYMSNTEPVIVFTKADLDKNKAIELARAYDNIGIKTFLSNLNQDDYSDMVDYFKDKIVLSVGNSGVGKSTLLNQIKNENIQKTSEISQSLGRGKHTTRHVEIFNMDGFYLIDTPGFASLELNFLNEGKRLSDYFPEFRKYSCKFNTCEHINEPNCGVKKALVNGNILESRYKSYLQLKDELNKLEERRW